MSDGLPPLNALRAFEAAARLGSFSAAADSLHVTHGAISRQVRALEEWLGVQLFDRHGRRVALTAPGRNYFLAVQGAFQNIAGATRRVMESGAQRRLTLDALPTFTMHWLLPRLTRFQMRHPGVELNLITSDRPPDLGMHVDLVIRRGPLELPGYFSREFLVEREIPVCSPAVLARLPLREVRDLKRHTLLSSAGRSQSWPRWLAEAGAKDLEPKGWQQFDHFYLTLQAAVDGMGVALGPRPVIDRELEAGRLVMPLPGPTLPSRAYYWLVPESRMNDPALRDFCDWLLEEAGSAHD